MPQQCASGRSAVAAPRCVSLGGYPRVFCENAAFVGFSARSERSRGLKPVLWMRMSVLLPSLRSLELLSGSNRPLVLASSAVPSRMVCRVAPWEEADLSRFITKSSVRLFWLIAAAFLSLTVPRLFPPEITLRCVSLGASPKVVSDLQCCHCGGWVVFSGELAPSSQNWVFAIRASEKALLAEEST